MNPLKDHGNIEDGWEKHLAKKEKKWQQVFPDSVFWVCSLLLSLSLLVISPFPVVSLRFFSPLADLV